MKRIIPILITILLVFPLITDAQIEQGQLFLNGSSNLAFAAKSMKFKFDDNDKEDGYKYMSFNLRPAAGFTVADFLVVGLFLNADIATYKYSDDSEDKETYTELSGGPFVRYYFFDLENFMPFAEGSAGYGTYREKYGDEDPYKLGYFSYRLGAGFSYFFNDHVGMDLFLGYENETYTDKEAGESGDQTYKEFHGGIVANLGIVATIGH